MAVKVDGFGQTGADEIAQLYAGIEQAQNHVQGCGWVLQQTDLHHHIDQWKGNADEKHAHQAQTIIKQERQGKDGGKHRVQSIEANVAVDLMVGSPTACDLPNDKSDAQNNQYQDAEVEAWVRVQIKPSYAVSPRRRSTDENAQAHCKQQP